MLKQECLRDQERSLEKCLPDNAARMQRPSIKVTASFISWLFFETVCYVSASAHCMSCHPSSEGTLLSPLAADSASLQVPMCLPAEKSPMGGNSGGERAEWGSFECVAGAVAARPPAGVPSLLKERASKSGIKINRIKAERKMRSKPGLPIFFAVTSSASVRAVQPCFSFSWTSQKLQLPEILNKLN